MARVDQTGDWRDRHAPSLAEFESLAIDAYAKLPDGFRAHTGNVAIIVADFPDDDIFEDMGLETPFDLLGLFEGVGMTLSGGFAQTDCEALAGWICDLLDALAEGDDR